MKMLALLFPVALSLLGLVRVGPVSAASITFIELSEGASILIADIQTTTVYTRLTQSDLQRVLRRKVRDYYVEYASKTRFLPRPHGH